MDMWRDPCHIEQSLHLPLKNEFIPTDFSLRNSHVSKNRSNSPHPVCILDQPMMKLWYKLDLTFDVPRANSYFLVSVKGAYSSLRNSILTELFINLLKDELNETLYQVHSLFHPWQINLVQIESMCNGRLWRIV